VYPGAAGGHEPGCRGDATGRRAGGGSGDDEFAGIRDYREGDSPRRVYWKGLARGQALQSKEYAAVVADARWLDWAQFPGLGPEQRLSALCYWVLEYHRRELEFGLRLPGARCPGRPATGSGICAAALALFGIEDQTDRRRAAGKSRPRPMR
jgi:uncharacterized protein (DUF58 family)